MALVDSPALANINAPIKSTSLPSEAYVLSIVSLPSHYAVSASSPDNAIYLFDKSRLGSVHTLPGHESSITTLRSASLLGNTSPVLLSSGRDGVIKAWDGRVPSASPIMTASSAGKTRSLLSCDVSADGTIIAAGTDLQGDDAILSYWDPRSPAAPLYSHASTHSDDITAVHFSRTGGNVLLSVSSDGLVCTSNANEVDEDEAGLHVGNWGCSIAQAGWVHGHTGAPRIWASSDMETFSVWSGELDLVQDNDIRQPSVHRQDLTWVTDYLIGCHNNSSISPDADNDLSIFVGSNEGDLALLSRPTFSGTNSPWHLSSIWKNGHVGIVRSVLWDEANHILLTGGEDSKLDAWTAPTLSLSGGTTQSKRENNDAMDVDDNPDTPRHKKKRA